MLTGTQILAPTEQILAPTAQILAPTAQILAPTVGADSGNWRTATNLLELWREAYSRY